MSSKPEIWSGSPTVAEPVALSSIIGHSDHPSAGEIHTRQFDLEDNPKACVDEEKIADTGIETNDVDPNLVCPQVSPYSAILNVLMFPR